jgi:apolipoprotein N-acyltransferase
MKTLVKTFGPAVLSGVALSLAFPRCHAAPLAWMALVPLLWRTWQAAPRTAFVHFFLAGFTFNLVLLHWLMTNVYWAGGWAFWGYLALSGALALYWGALGALWQFVCTRIPVVPRAIALAVLWAAMEHLQSFLFSGFGWGAIGYSQGLDLPLAQWAAVGGVPLISAFIVLTNGLLAGIVSEARARFPRMMSAVIVFAAVHGAGAAMLGHPAAAPRDIVVGIVQAEFPLEIKWDREYTSEMVRNTAEKSRMIASQSRVDLFVWPESLVMEDIERPDIWKEVSGLTRDTRTPLFTGSVRTDTATGADLNSSHLVNPQGEITGTYDKIHLAPFGEYVPFGDYFPILKKVVPAIGDIRPGHAPQVMTVGDRKFGPLICFEVLFAPMAERLRDMGADFLVVITDLGWFGASSALPQELEIARFRAIETRLPLVHAANSGISGVFDPWGRFQGVNIYFDGKDNAYRFDDVPVQETTMSRLGGALTVTSPGAWRWPISPRRVPEAALVLTVAGGVAAALRKPRPTE